MPAHPKPARAARQVRNADVSRAKVWAAAADEFAARGFDGAKVDRIAAGARVNKAMIYYHFKSKGGLFHAILHDTFASIAEAVRGVRAAGGTPEVQIGAYVEAIARIAEKRPFFPPIWLREIAESGRHVDVTCASHFLEVLKMLSEILREGVAAGTMRPVHPFLVQLGVVGPLTLFIASRPMRAKFAQMHRGLDVSIDEVVAHLQATVLSGISVKQKVRKAR